MGESASGDNHREAQGNTPEEGDLRVDGHRVRLRGRTLSLILWLAGHQTRINETAPESGQIWLTWKGSGPRSIDGDIRTRL